MKPKIAIDFDGVIHQYSKGWHDGTIYDPPMEGCREALEKLDDDFEIIIFSCRASTDEKKQMIIKWLEKYDMYQFISDITVVKPHACIYIDDRAIHHVDWPSTLTHVKYREMPDDGFDMRNTCHHNKGIPTDPEVCDGCPFRSGCKLRIE